jgi:hypothetical protein
MCYRSTVRNGPQMAQSDRYVPIRRRRWLVQVIWNCLSTRKPVWKGQPVETDVCLIAS